MRFGGKARRRAKSREEVWLLTLHRRWWARRRRTLALFRPLPPPGHAFPRRRGWADRIRARRARRRDEATMEEFA